MYAAKLTLALICVQRSTLCAGFPVSLDFVRDKRAPRSPHLQPSTLRIQWRGVLERYASTFPPPAGAALDALLEAAHSTAGNVPRLSSSRPRSLRPLSATVIRLTGKQGVLKAVHDGSMVGFTLAEDSPATLEIVRPGQRIFYWRGHRADGAALALLGRAPGAADRWPTLALCSMA